MEEDSVGKPAAKSTALSIVYSYLNSLSFVSVFYLCP